MANSKLSMVPVRVLSACHVWKWVPGRWNWMDILSFYDIDEMRRRLEMNGPYVSGR